jgi:hypothetical protein
MKTSIFAVGAALVASATATNNVKFINRCPYDIYFWTVGPAGSNLYVALFSEHWLLFSEL